MATPRAQGLGINIIVVMVIAVIVMVTLALFFTGAFRKQGKDFMDYQSSGISPEETDEMVKCNQYCAIIASGTTPLDSIARPTGCVCPGELEE